jgi:Fic family protein
MDDLVAYANRDDLDPIAQAGAAHAQFEIIHPFADGNGRIGRVLISWLLGRRLALVVPPPVSARIAGDRDGYLSGLALYRLGDHERWIRWFADVVAGAAASEAGLVRVVADVKAGWRERLRGREGGRVLRRDALAWKVLDLLPQSLVLTSALVAERLGSTPRAARGALVELAEAGVLAEYGSSGGRRRGRPAHAYMSPELLALVGS